MHVGLIVEAHLLRAGKKMQDEIVDQNVRRDKAKVKRRKEKGEKERVKVAEAHRHKVDKMGLDAISSVGPINRLCACRKFEKTKPIRPPVAGSSKH
jgi:hypothetical protein